jgi:hypothetical protein
VVFEVGIGFCLRTAVFDLCKLKSREVDNDQKLNMTNGGDISAFKFFY